MNEHHKSDIIHFLLRFSVHSPVAELQSHDKWTKQPSVWTIRFVNELLCLLLFSLSWLSRDKWTRTRGVEWVVTESFLFPVLLAELMQLPPAMWRGRVLHENERIISVSCPADWAYAAAACHVARDGTAWKWTNHSLRRLVTPESYKRLVHDERNVREWHITRVEEVAQHTTLRNAGAEYMGAGEGGAEFHRVHMSILHERFRGFWCLHCWIKWQKWSVNRVNQNMKAQSNHFYSFVSHE